MGKTSLRLTIGFLRIGLHPTILSNSKHRARHTAELKKRNASPRDAGSGSDNAEENLQNEKQRDELYRGNENQQQRWG